MKYIKIYDDNEHDGYVSIKNIHFFDVSYHLGEYEGDAHYIVRACEFGDKVDEGYQASPKIDDKYEAYAFMDSVVEKLV